MENLFSFNGRSGRLEYWISQLIYSVFYFALMFGQETQNDSLTLIGFMGLVIGFVPVVAYQVKRFHDLNKHGALVLINLIPFGGIVTLVWLGFFGPVNTIDNSNDYGIDPRLVDAE